jgi:uncharacterized protein YoxC
MCSLRMAEAIFRFEASARIRSSWKKKIEFAWRDFHPDWINACTVFVRGWIAGGPRRLHCGHPQFARGQSRFCIGQRNLNTVHRQVKAVRRDLKAVHRPVNAVRRHLNTVHRHVKGVHRRVNAVRRDLNAVHRPLNRVHHDLKAVRRKLNAVHRRVKAVHPRFSRGQQPQHFELELVFIVGVFRRRADFGIFRFRQLFQIVQQPRIGGRIAD